MGWKTILGGFVTAIGYVAQPEVLSMLPGKVAGVVSALGIVLTTFGVRHAIAKIGGGK